ncbi:hypothetical protein [Niabella hirudinis]|uniref:hypothetical protein n=1 Tax=Niabella hirudinis TaxID=1285929 RepID=UPI003EBBA562
MSTKQYLTYLYLFLACLMLGKQSADAQQVRREKIYLHLDKENYFTGEHIWFKVYLVNDENRISDSSGVSYIELIDQHKGLVKQIALNTKLGLAVGDFTIDTTMEPGRYYIRAYTRWMQNFGDSLFFQRAVTVFKKDPQWLLKKTRVTGARQSGTGRLNVDLNLEKGRSNAEAVTNVFVYSNGKRINNSKIAITNGAAKIDLDLSTKEAAGPLTVKTGASEEKIDNVVELLNKPALDLQFMPESGYLVAGYLNKVAFKAIGPDGYGVSVSGKIVGGKNTAPIPFRSVYRGMGTVAFTPLAGEQYTAVLEDGTTIQLPGVQAEGTLLQVQNDQKQLAITAICSDRKQGDLFLVVECRGKEMTRNDLENSGKTYQFTSDLDGFAPGVYVAKLMRKDGALLNERAFFVKPQAGKMRIRTVVSREADDSVMVKINTPVNVAGKGVGIYSVSVTDDFLEQPAADRSSILSYLLLESDLRGYVEGPAWYFSEDAAANEALDALMLTQGFVRYEWKPAGFKEQAEHEFEVKGKITNALFRGVSGKKIALYGKGIADTYIRLYTASKEKGLFTFNNVPQFDTTYFDVREFAEGKIENPRDLQTYTVKRKVGRGLEIIKPRFPAPGLSYILGDSVDHAALVREHNQLRYEDAREVLKGEGVLEEVFVEGIKKIPRSKNLNGAGKVDLALSQKDLIRNAGKSLTQTLLERVPGLQAMPSYRAGANTASTVWSIMDPKTKKMIARPVYFLFDGMWAGSIDGYSKDDLFSADELLGIEVMYSRKYTEAYYRKYMEDIRRFSQSIKGLSEYEFAIIEITTKAGRAGYYRPGNAAAAYSPVPFHYGKTVYTPLYLHTPEGEKNRAATLYWNGNLITDTTGQTEMKFYLPKTVKNYTIRTEGIDVNGYPAVGVQAVNSQ